MDPKDLHVLGDQLLHIEETKFRQIVGLLEQMNEHPDVQRTMAAIRPRLAELRVHRRPTLKRLFCEPFEDLFQPFNRAVPAPLNTLERALMNRLWPLVEAQIGRERLKDFSPALKDGPQRDTAADAFWAEAAATVQAIAGQSSDAGRFDDALELRMNPSRVQAVADIALILSIAPEIRALKRALAPKPVPKLHPDHLEDIQEIGRRVTRTRPEALRPFVRIAASRMADPSNLLGALWTMDLGQKAADRADLFLQLSGTVVSQIEERSRTLRTSPQGSADRLAVADLAVDLMASLEATRAAMEQSRNKDFDKRLKEVRSSLHEMVRSQVLDGAEADIVGAIGALDGGAGDRAQLVQAENQARALRKCGVIADTLGLRGELKAVTQKATSSLVDTARQALGSGPAANTRSGYSAIRMIELIAGPAEANKVMDEILRDGKR